MWAVKILGKEELLAFLFFLNFIQEYTSFKNVGMGEEENSTLN